MRLLAHKLIACVLLLAILFAGLSCACAYDEQGDSFSSQAGVAACHHSQDDSDHDQDDQNRPDSESCKCVAHMVYLNNHGGTPDLRPATMASWTYFVDPMFLSPALTVQPINGHFTPMALSHLHRASTTLLYQHCALII